MDKEQMVERTFQQAKLSFLWDWLLRWVENTDNMGHTLRRIRMINDPDATKHWRLRLEWDDGESEGLIVSTGDSKVEVLTGCYQKWEWHKMIKENEA